MSTLTVFDVERALLDSLIDLHEDLLTRRLECSDEQAVALLKNYRKVEEELLLLLEPDLSTLEYYDASGQCVPFL